MKPFSEINFELRTERLFLRPLCEKDAKLLYPYVVDPEIAQYMMWTPHKNISETKRFIRSTQKDFQKQNGIVWAIFLEKEFIGLISVTNIIQNTGDIIHMRGDMGYWLSPKFWGKGIMTEAGKTVLHFGFYRIGLHKITVAHFSENMRSKRVIEKLGFRLVGEQKKHYFKNGKWWDHMIYELLREDEILLKPVQTSVEKITGFLAEKNLKKITASQIINEKKKEYENYEKNSHQG